MSGPGVGSYDAVIGSCAGTIYGDALGLPYEALAPRRALRLLGTPDRHRFIFQYGMVSDDAEHTLLTAWAYQASGADPDAFASKLGTALRTWFLAAPPGIGLATTRSCAKLCFGVHPTRSGVESAGNGPCMRAAVLGAAEPDADRLASLLRISTRATHRDPRAALGACLIAAAARQAADRGSPDADSLWSITEQINTDRGRSTDMRNTVSVAIAAGSDGQPLHAALPEVATDKGVSGFVVHSAAAALWAWFRFGTDIRRGVDALIRLGGDTDSIAATYAGIAGAAATHEPDALRHNVFLLPASWKSIDTIARACHHTASRKPGHTAPGLSYGRLLVKNVLQLFVILVHIIHRLRPW